MKTSLTTQMEEVLYYYCRENGDIVVEEVTMPEEQGIVDTLSCRLTNEKQFEWRCYELKASKADFRSKAKLSFIGNYNYFVLPAALFTKVKEEIPSHIGVMVYHQYLSTEDQLLPGYFTIEKKPQRQPLLVNEQELLFRLITSQAREVGKAKQTARGLRAFSTDQLYKELKKRQPDYDLFGGGVNFYDRFVEDCCAQAVEALKNELDATREAYFELERRLLEEK
ncbi:hypothetical protein UAY_00313 [Enterococcus moraviensis ATCC BAA-383]|uniref:Uncharacterized protein n=1 Tax=Enterococcus moraviensis ATCC BAA-383 TaxID=1158609 RepID=R2RH59_9ENTE|nr:hypothetical protein [Enterococcus moraviensis]EOI06971.1 hypothetical protein UAY_00313 [Enterococcus moraviensis ATCC BAA-383]EOT65313.1 hypothetical protein I586_03047 [Enterococcus moraviensis ATCC BAA-383]OJG66798.1 hypothetical protein RV09_GL003267 [Enterococcus moraviensis]